MTTEKPRLKRAYVHVRDPETGESEHVTLYDSSVAEILNRLKVSPDARRTNRRADKKHTTPPQE